MLVLSIAFTNLACGGAKALSKGSGAANGETVSFKSLEKESSMEVTYAKNFSVDYYKGGFTLITIDSNDHRFLMVPEGVATPTDLDKDIVAIQKPLDNIYLVAVAAMTFFDTLDAVDTVKFSGAKEDGWYVDSAKKAMQEGKIKYAGKYSEPDYETLISQKARLSIQSGMIMHSPDVQEKLEKWR